MGQQQMLLVILITILVGIATIVAINTFQDAHEGANMDAVRQEIFQAHSQSQSFYSKPVQLGGGGGSFSMITLSDILLPEENDNALYEITETSDDSFTLSYKPQSLEGTYTATISYNEVTWNGESEE